MASDKLQAMRAFRRVAELGSFSAAADDLNITPASVSKLIAFLEHSVGTRLIHRTTRRMHLSDSGIHYLASVSRMLDELDETESRMRGLDASPRGKIRINAPMSFGLMHLPSVIDSFLDVYPDIEVDLQLSDHVVDLVEQGVDIALRVKDQLPDSSMTARLLCDTHRVVCASPEYLAAHGTPAHPNDLRQHNCLVYSRLATPRRWKLGEHIVEVNGRCSVDSSLAIRQSVLRGQGITLIPTFLVFDDLRAGRLKAILPEYTPSGHQLYAVFPPGRHRPDRVKVFLEHLVAAFGNPPYWENY